MGGTRLDEALDRVEKISATVRDGAAESERLGRLAPEVFDALQETGLFRILVPVDRGGLDLTLPEATEVIARVGALDASTGWTLGILSDGPIFARFLPSDTFAALMDDPATLMCGTLNPMGARAEIVDDGFLFSGRATYLSGSAHANWTMATAIVTRDGEPVIDENGIGIAIRAGMFPTEHARCLDTWHVTGMRATGSSDYELESVLVAEDHTFEPFRPRSASSVVDVFSGIPLWSQLGGMLAAVAVGAAANMVERFIELASVKVPVGNFSRLAERAPAQMAIGEAQGLYQAASAVLTETANAIWERGLARAPFDNDVLARHRLGYVTAVRLSAQAIDLLHDAAGMSAVASDSVLDRCWRDVHTMTQHIVLSPARFEIAGRVLMGLDPQSPVI
jgi:indole-3-acetate monooxygenase